MFSFFCGVLRRLIAPLALASLLFAGPLAAHERHDHGAAAAPVTTTGSPRIALHSDAYELVGVLRGSQLALFLDRYAGNEPVVDARITVSIGTSGDVAAMPALDGTYLVSSEQLVGAGPLELVFAITHAQGDDLLFGTLDRPAAPAASATDNGALPKLQAASLSIAGKQVPVLYLASGEATQAQPK